MSKRTETGPIAGGCGTPSGDEIFVKEKDKRERSKENKEKESVFSPASPRAREKLPLVIDIHTPPSLELLLAFAHHNCGFFDDTYTREWYRIMSEELYWCHPDTGESIRHWPAYFRLWRENRHRFEAFQDPERYASRNVRRGRKADNWRGTRPEDIGNALG